MVPFTGRRADLEALAQWRDDLQERLAVRLVHGPGGQGKTRLAAHFADLSRRAQWMVWQASVNEAGTERMDTTAPLSTAAGVLLVVDYAERWPVPDLHKLLVEPLIHRGGFPVRVLLLARPAGAWWESLATWIDDDLDAPADAHPLPPLAATPYARSQLFQQARDRFAEHLGLAHDQANRIGPPLTLDTDEDYAQVLTVHIAALAAVDVLLHDYEAPIDPARASAYLLKRERAHWTALNQRTSKPLASTPTAMGRTVLTATLTRPLARPHGWTALRQVGLADSTEAANVLLDDHQYCYPPARPDSVLEPLYPDRLGEDFLGLTTPDRDHPVPDAVTDDWAHQAAERLLTASGAPLPWTREALTVLIETARRWPHIATGELYPLLKRHPELALHAGGAALANLANLNGIDPTVLEAIEPRLPRGRHTDLDIGIATVAYRLAHHRLATTQDPLAHARVRDNLARRLHYAGLRDEALTTARDALRAWRHITQTDPSYGPGLAGSLSGLGLHLSAMGRHEEALTAIEEAVALNRSLAEANPASHQPELARTLTNLGLHLSNAGRHEEALTATKEAVTLYRPLAEANPAAHQPELARTLTNLGLHLSNAGRHEEALTATEEALTPNRPLAEANPAAHQPELARTLTNLGHNLSSMGRHEEALTATEEALTLYRRLAEANPAAHQPGLAESLRVAACVWVAGGEALPKALDAVVEALGIFRRLAAAVPKAFGGSVRATEVTRADVLEALGHTQEAVEIRRRLEADQSL